MNKDEPLFTKKKINDHLNEVLFSAQSNISTGAYIVYLLLGISHIFVLDSEHAVIMAPVAFLTAIFMGVLTKILNSGKLSSNSSPIVSICILFFILVNSLLQILILKDIDESTNFIIIILGVSMIQLRNIWYYSSLSAVIVSWIIISSPWMGSDKWVHYIFSIFLSSSLSIVFHIAINKFLKRLMYNELERNEQRKEIESTLTQAVQSENILKRLTEAAVEGIVFHNGKNILDCNEQLSRMFGYKEINEIIGIPISAIISPKELEIVSFNIAKSASYTYESIGLKKNGNEFPIEIGGKTIDDKDSEIYRVAVIRDLTEQRRVQAQLKESEKNYRLIAENTHDIISRYSDVYGFLYISPSCYTITGYTSEELSKNDRYLSFFKIRNKDEIDDNTDRSATIVRKMMRKDGKEIWLETVLQYVQVGSEQEVFGVSREVTTRVKNERFLTAQYDVATLISGNPDSNAFLVQIMEIICNDLDWAIGELWYPTKGNMLHRKAVWHVNDEKISNFVEKSNDMYFKKGEGLPGLVWTMQIPVWMEDVVTNDLFVRSELAASAGIHTALSFPVFDGERLYCFMLLFSRSIMEKDKNLLNILHSLGGQLGQYMKRREAEKELEKSESLFRTMSKFSPVGIFVTNPDGKCIYTNKRYQEITKLKFEETLDDGWVSVIHPDDLEMVSSGWYKAVKKNRKYTGTHRIKLKDDEIRWVNVHGAEFRDEEGIVGHVGTMEDITEFRRQEEELLEYSKNLSEMVEERTKELKVLQKKLLRQQRDQQELRLAAEVQQSLLPHREPVLQGFSIASAAFPARYVSGDFYDFDMLSSDSVQIVIADIAGKGIPAALLTTSARAFLRAPGKSNTSPEAVLSSLNQIMYDDLSNAEKFITMQITEVDSNTGRIGYSSAGHTESLLYLAKDNKVARLSPTTIPLGIERIIDSGMKEFYLRPGDLFLLYSDGVTEAENSEGELFGIERLKDILMESGKAGLSSRDAVESIVNSINGFAGSRSSSDDITIILIKSEERSFTIEKQGVFDNLDILVEWIQKKCLVYGEELAMQIELAASELITNIIKHSYGQKNSVDTGNIRIELHFRYHDIELRFYDTGYSFDYDQIKKPDLDEPKEGGYGIWLLNEIMDSVEYIAGTGENENQWILNINV